jgi:hypothetical protein
MVVAIDTRTRVRLVEDETAKLIDWARQNEQADATIFEKSQAFARRMGAHYRSDGLTEVVFWAPRLLSEVMQEHDIYLEVLTPTAPINPGKVRQTIEFHRDRVHLVQHNEFFWGVIDGMEAGTRDRFGSFYWLRYVDLDERLRAIRDVMPYSLPFGIFAPAELYDIAQLDSHRPDLDYFRRTGNGDPTASFEKIPRVGAPRNILELHIGTASRAGTFAGLTAIYQEIARKLEAGEELTHIEQNYVGYDAIELLPTEPPIEYRDEYSPESEFFSFIKEEEETVTIELSKPNTEDWGYDVPIIGSSTTNPALLESLRPDEVVDFIATLHNFPTGPIQLIYDLVYGHADNQAELLLNRPFLKGPNMYGQDLNHQFPTVRAIFLEMQRRKINTGADGIRVDGGQDIRFFNPLSGQVEHDNAYLMEMGDVVQELGGSRRLMFLVYEDGRPWPAEGWEESSTYRELVEMKPGAYQWGPLIFAHNTPTLKGFWDLKWRRVCEVMNQGEDWITGCANHDTVRRGNQVLTDADIDWSLGSTMPEVLQNAYDNPAIMLWVYGFSPGLPMDFINSTMRSPWMFFRNTDERYGVKVVSEEAGFLEWQLTHQQYAHRKAFRRLKKHGFKQLEELQLFVRTLEAILQDKEYNLAAVTDALRACPGSIAKNNCDLPVSKLHRSSVMRFLAKIDIDRLKEFAADFMSDCFEECNVSYYNHNLDPRHTRFNLSMREFRHAHPWLRRNLQNIDRFNKISDGNSTVFYGVRSNPDHPQERIAMVTHLGGEPMKATLGDWLQLDFQTEDWQVVHATPGLEIENLEHFELSSMQGVLLYHCDPELGCVIEPDSTVKAEPASVFAYAPESSGVFCDTDRAEAEDAETQTNPIADVTAISEEAEDKDSKSSKSSKAKAKTKSKAKSSAKSKTTTKAKAKPKTTKKTKAEPSSDSKAD